MTRIGVKCIMGSWVSIRPIRFRTGIIYWKWEAIFQQSVIGYGPVWGTYSLNSFWNRNLIKAKHLFPMSSVDSCSHRYHVINSCDLYIIWCHLCNYSHHIWKMWRAILTTCITLHTNTLHSSILHRLQCISRAVSHVKVKCLCGSPG